MKISSKLLALFAFVSFSIMADYLAQTCESPGGAPFCERVASSGQIISKDPGVGGCPPDGICRSLCVGGEHAEEECLTFLDCRPGGICPLPTCDGGPNDGVECLDDGDCASQACTFGEHCDQTDSFVETHLSDEGDEECLRENLFFTGGTNNRLEHKWVFKFVPQGNQCLTYEGYRAGSDNFDWLQCSCNRFAGECAVGGSAPFCDQPDGFIQLNIPEIDNPFPDVSREAFIQETFDNDREFHMLLSDVQVMPDAIQDEVLIDHLKLITYPAAEPAVSDYQTDPGTIISGNYTDTHTSNNTREILQEEPDGTNSRLKQVWRFDNVPGGGTHELLIEGRRPDNADGDNFKFGWNTTGGLLFQLIPGAVIDSFAEPAGGVRYFLADENLSGTVYILAQDTIGAGNDLARLEVDRIAIVTLPDCSFCGDGVQDPDEVCDGGDLGMASCADVGCTNGAVTCNGNCSANYSNCTDCCDLDDTCEPNENCFSCPYDCLSENSPGAQCGNGVCEIGDGEDCLSCPGDCNGVQTGKPSNRFCCGDGEGQTPVDCGDSRCTTGGFSCTDVPNPPVNFCCGDGIQQPDEGDGTICDGNY